MNVSAQGRQKIAFHGEDVADAESIQDGQVNGGCKSWRTGRPAAAQGGTAGGQIFRRHCEDRYPALLHPGVCRVGPKDRGEQLVRLNERQIRGEESETHCR